MGIGKATALTSIVSSILFAAAPASAADVRPSPWEREVVYQIFPRSFHDSNGDRIGDLKGIASKLGHLQKLGVTAILLNPVFASRTYHNYFADDFLTIDPEFGTNRDFFALVRQAHRRRMKVILDMEVQYVADRHRWFTADPKKDYLWREGSAFYGKDLPWYDGAKIEIAAINPDHPEVRAHIRKVFRYWADPNGDGNPSDGVDGFRIDHMMDDLDLKGVKKGMLEGFWRSLEQEIRRLNPKVLFVGEQSDWGLGKDLFEKADVDAVFALPLWYAIRKLEKDRLQREILATALATPPGKTQFLAIENHDTDRFASEMNRHPDLLRLGAVLNLTLKGTPVIYYGQELGMTG
jgi:glycosidase